MSVVVIGMNHRTVPLGLLERMTIDDSRIPKALHDVAGREHVSEAVVLSTCNRLEIYVVAERFHGAYQDVRDFLCEMAYLPPEEFADHLYVHYDDDAVAHLFAVASGLDSAVVGESEVLGQVRSAWEVAREEGTAGSQMNLLFRHALEVGKRARTETSIARHVASVSSAAIALASQCLDGLADRRVLVLGAGDMGEGMVRSLAQAGVGELFVANRTWERALELADAAGARAIRLAELHDVLAGVDLLLTGTGANAMVLEAADLARIMEARQRRPLLVVDIAVPRDVDPAAAGIDGITLLDMDALRSFVEAGLNERRREMSAVEAIVEDELARFTALSSAREVAPLISSIRDKAEMVRSAELERFVARLGSLDPAELDAIDALTKSIVAKLLHDPTVQLKDAAGSPRGERLAESLRDLFEL